MFLDMDVFLTRLHILDCTRTHSRIRTRLRIRTHPTHALKIHGHHLQILRIIYSRILGSFISQSLCYLHSSDTVSLDKDQREKKRNPHGGFYNNLKVQDGFPVFYSLFSAKTMSMEAFLLINENFLLECARERGQRHAPVSCGLIVASREMEKKEVGQERACILVFNNNDINCQHFNPKHPHSHYPIREVQNGEESVEIFAFYLALEVCWFVCFIVDFSLFNRSWFVYWF